MTDLPYTEDDLRAEAARQHMTLTEDPEFMCVGEAMEDSLVPSCMGEATGPAWGDLLHDEEFATAQRAIHDLIRKAADLSEWAVEIGADGLEPSTDVLTIKGGDEPLIRLHFGFRPDMSEEMRQAFITGLGEELAHGL